MSDRRISNDGNNYKHRVRKNQNIGTVIQVEKINATHPSNRTAQRRPVKRSEKTSTSQHQASHDGTKERQRYKYDKMRTSPKTHPISGSEDRKQCFRQNNVGGKCAKRHAKHLNKRSGSLPSLYRSDNRINIQPSALKHSYSWPSLENEFSMLKLTEFRAKFSGQKTGKNVDSAGRRHIDRCSKPKWQHNNRIAHSAKSHRERTPEKIKSGKKQSNDRHVINRPKPPSWQNFKTVFEDRETDVQNCKMDSSSGRTKTRHKSLELTDKKFRSNIHRTHSMVIETSEMPETTNLVIPLAKSKHNELRIRGKEFDDIFYMSENEQRCREWLKTLESAEFKHQSVTIPADVPEKILSNNDTVTCDLELAEDRWDFLISPYPKGKINTSL